MKKYDGLFIGLTGQTGAGKTTVSSYLADLGHKVIDADLVARQVVAPGGCCLAELVVSFGEGILLPNGNLDRQRLGDIVFADEAKLALLNKIIFPHIREEIDRRVMCLRAAGAAVIFLDAPTLFESGIDRSCDKIISVIAPEVIRLERIVARDKLTQERALSRIRAQHNDEFYTSRSDYVIRNSGDPAELREQLNSIIDKIEIDYDLEESQ
ncbi:MAG: dephospho-CoA kinase [Oscillospiraceae bacterium]|nr:dephospho-CoA kinase [Oscillospiraceae bacterium]